ncbi:DNA polymerase III subunit delta' [Nitrosococcus wardiae]|nr:DNA polymerase III subunit delta' [Nitrosococcus wardiae]
MASRVAKRMPHALLLAGPEGVGKRDFAANLVQTLSCEHPQEGGQGCGFCAGCRLQRAGSHPDNMILLPKEGKQTISVDQIRQVQTHLALKARQSGAKTVTILPAEEMTLSAANSLLKVLEEPPGETVLILITAMLSRLPITIRSRCQRLWFSPPHLEEAQLWLQQRLPPSTKMNSTALLTLTGGAPLRALEYIQQDFLSLREHFIKNLFFLAQGKADPLEITQNYLKNDLGEPLYWMSTLVGDMVRLKGGVSEQFLINRDIADSLQLLAERTDVKMLFRFLEKVDRDLWLWKGQISVNPQLLLEGLLIQWSWYFSEVNYECI